MADPFFLNVEGVRQLVESDVNKHGGDSSNSPEGAEGDKIGVLELPMTDEKLLKLRDDYEKAYAPYETKYKDRVKKNKESYLGSLASGQWIQGEDVIAANLQFEAEETFLAAALSKNPEPVVYADNTPEGNAVSTAVKTMLGFHADQLNIRRKLSIMVRQWSIYHLGVVKYGWNTKINDVEVEIRKIQDFVFDPHGYVEADGSFSSWLGERITVTAEKLIDMFPKHKAYITLLVDGKLGTDCVYTEWWTDEYCFSTFKDVVLDKHKNEFFKYEEPVIDPATGQTAINPIDGQPIIQKPRNHFAVPIKPYTFLSVFSLCEQPHDITGLIEQNIPNQNRITRQTEQIDYNIASANNSFILSEDNFNQETGKQFANARRKGNPALVPSGGPLSNAYALIPPNDLPAAFFNSVETHKNDLRSSWGIQGIASQPPEDDQTARGMILDQSHDTSRIGGGIGQSIEIVAKGIFNWLVQLYYVFYDEQHFAAIMGNAKAVEYVTLTSTDLDRQLIITVSPDSMKPKDEVTNINLAQALFDKGAIGPKTLLKMVDFPNPDESAADGVLYRLDPATYFRINFPEEFAKMQQAQMEQAQLGMMQQAQAKGMETAAVAANTPPEDTTEPEQPISQAPASAALSNVPIATPAAPALA